MKLLRKRACPERNVSANSVFSDLLQLQLHFSHVHPVCVCVCVQHFIFCMFAAVVCALGVRVCLCVCVCAAPLFAQNTASSSALFLFLLLLLCIFLFFIGSCSGKEKGCVPAVKTVKTTNQTKLLLQPHPFCELFRVKQQLINCTQGKRNYNKKCMQKKMSIIMHVQQQQTHVTELPPGGLSLPPTPPTPPALSLFLLPARC